MSGGAAAAIILMNSSRSSGGYYGGGYSNGAGPAIATLVMLLGVGGTMIGYNLHEKANSPEPVPYCVEGDIKDINFHENGPAVDLVLWDGSSYHEIYTQFSNFYTFVDAERTHFQDEEVYLQMTRDIVDYGESTYVCVDEKGNLESIVLNVDDGYKQDVIMYNAGEQ